MGKKQSESAALRAAFEILESVNGKPQTIEERKHLCIDLASLILKEAKKNQTRKEKKHHKLLSKMMKDPTGKAFTTAVADQCFRTTHLKRTADQLTNLIHQFGIPRFLPLFKRLGLSFFKYLSPSISRFFLPFFYYVMRKQLFRVILPAEHDKLLKHLYKRTEQGVRLNINHIGEAILGEDEAKRRLQVYLDDLEQPSIDYVSLKISTIFSQINHLAFEDTIEKIAKKLRRLFQQAIDNPRKLENGEQEPKFVNLDMEEYQDLHLTVQVFQKVLSEPEFHNLSAGIVLQAYLPDIYAIQQNLTEWAKNRIKNGGAPIKIRIVKGANLANEQVEASIHCWPQAPYLSKKQVDANFKRLLLYAMIPENARAAHIGVASHNLFDLAFALILMSEYQVEPYVDFEMLEGMAEHIQKALKKFVNNVILYCPIAKKRDFQHAIAYLIRRLDENTGEENFLKDIFGLKQGSNEWERQVRLFLKSISSIDSISDQPRRKQDRNFPDMPLIEDYPFENIPDTDFSLTQNQSWAKQILDTYKMYAPESIPCTIGKETLLENELGQGFNPSNPNKPYYNYMLAKKEHIEQCLQIAKNYQQTWKEASMEERLEIFFQISKLMREKRAELMGVMMMDVGKNFTESDSEISEGIDYVEYYARQMKRIDTMKDIQHFPKGTVLVTPPWNFSYAIPLGGVLSSLICGNCVIFKPAPEAVLVGWHIVNILWSAGVPKEALQFLNCEDEPEGSRLIQDPRVDKVVLTGATSTAKAFLKLRVDLDLSAETGGKNAMIITNMCDRDLAIKDLIHSAFSYSGQKCSAVSLAILEKEVYDDINFQKQLKDALQSQPVGPAWDMTTKIQPLIRKPNEILFRALTALEKNEYWLTTPKQDPENPNLWSPGIKMGVQSGSFMHQNELFGPVLGVMRAKSFSHAIELANETQYGLTSGLHSLDLREQHFWKMKIEAGNCYINRSTTGAVVQRQPFGGWKNSSFGTGYKTGGPNYLFNLTNLKQTGLPKEKQPVNNQVNNLTSFIEKLDLSAQQLGIWYASISNYSYWWKRMRQDRDPTKLIGQDNFLRYVPVHGIVFRLYDHFDELDALRICAAALTCECPIEISLDSKNIQRCALNWLDLTSFFRVIDEDDPMFLKRLRSAKIKRCRFLQKPSYEVFESTSQSNCYVHFDPVMTNGSIELLHYVREISTSINYHRYGNLGVREGELRKPLF